MKRWLSAYAVPMKCSKGVHYTIMVKLRLRKTYILKIYALIILFIILPCHIYLIMMDSVGEHLPLFYCYPLE